jgi:hypothetical protein
MTIPNIRLRGADRGPGAHVPNEPLLTNSATRAVSRRFAWVRVPRASVVRSTSLMIRPEVVRNRRPAVGVSMAWWLDEPARLLNSVRNARIPTNCERLNRKIR